VLRMLREDAPDSGGAATRDVWRVAPHSLIGLYRGEQICGFAGMRPLGIEWATRLVAGRVHASSFGEADRPGLGHDPYALFVECVVLESSLRGNGYAAPFLARCSDRWFHAYGMPTSGEVWALGWSAAGRALLRHFGFSERRPGSLMADGAPLYAVDAYRLLDL
jgi:hypothetical protein